MKRQFRVSVRLSEEEKHQVDASASAARMPVSTYLREAALKNSAEVYSASELLMLRTELDEAHEEIGFFNSPALERAIILADRMLA